MAKVANLVHIYFFNKYQVPKIYILNQNFQFQYSNNLVSTVSMSIRNNDINKALKETIKKRQI